MSLVTCPCRNDFASAPVSASLPRSERSTSPHASVSARYPVSTTTATTSRLLAAHAHQPALDLVLELLQHALARHAGLQGRADDRGLLGAVEPLEQPQQAVEALAAG